MKKQTVSNELLLTGTSIIYSRYRIKNKPQFMVSTKNGDVSKVSLITKHALPFIFYFLFFSLFFAMMAKIEAGDNKSSGKTHRPHHDPNQDPTLTHSTPTCTDPAPRPPTSEDPILYQKVSLRASLEARN